MALTAALHRPLRSTQLQSSTRGNVRDGKRMALPLFRSPGSSADTRRRAESLLLGDSAKPLAAQAKAGSSASGQPKEIAKIPRLFRPNPPDPVDTKGKKGSYGHVRHRQT